MLNRVFFVVLILSIGFTITSAQDLPGETQVRSYFYDKQTSEFLEVPQTRSGADSLLAISWANRNNNLRKGLQAARRGLDLAESLRYEAGIAKAHTMMGVNYMRLGAHEQALKHYLTGLDMYLKNDNKKRAGRTLSNISMIHMHQENYKQAAKYNKRAIRQMRAVGDNESTAVATMNLGVIYYHREKYEKSLSYYEQALEMLNEKVENEFIKMVTYANMGNSHAELGNDEAAEDYLLTAIDYFDRKKLTRNQSGAYLYLAKLYERQGRIEEALRYGRRGLQKAKSIGNKQYIVEGYEQLASIFEEQKDYRQAYNLYKQFKTAQDSILNSERSAKINELQTRFEVSQKNREIQLLNKEAALQEAQLVQQKLWRNFLIIGLALFAIIGGLLYRYNNQKKKANLLLEQKNREIEKQNRQLVQLNDEKDEFLEMAAHDLRNPLSGIKSVASLLENEQNLSKEELHSYIDIISISSDRMVNLIDNLLDVNAIENGSSYLNIRTVSINEPVKRAVSNFEKLAEKKNIRIITNFDINIKPVAADKDAIQRMLENLISNATKYSPEGSTVKVIARMRQNHLELSVKDDGPGIPADEQPQLFKRYSTISNEPTGNESSTGLGLFIVKNLAEEMDGSVHCESRWGEGSEFIVTLPVATDVKQVG